MSESLETTRRLHAWASGKPTPRGEKINVHIANDDDIFVVAFLRMGGESRPWGVAFGKSNEQPTILTVAEGRNRTLVADMMLKFAPSLLEHFRHPQHSEESLSNWEANTHRQIWLPGPTHVDMLHFLALSYARTKWDRDGIDMLITLGNIANFLYIDQQRPGQQTVMTASGSLQQTHIFPASLVRQSHLGYLLGWLQGGRTRETRLAAACIGEKRSVATVLDPEYERKVVQPLVEQWGQANRVDDGKGRRSAEKETHKALAPELLHRWELTRDSIALLRSDRRKPNPGLVSLVATSKKEFHYGWGESTLSEYGHSSPFWPNPFTDYNTRTAAGNYHSRVADDQQARHYLVHGDKELQREELAAGHGIIGMIATVNSVEPKWTIRFSYPALPTISTGSYLVIAGAPDLKLIVSQIDHDQQTIIAIPKWKNAKPQYGKLGLHSRDSAWRGKELVLLDDKPFQISRGLAKSARQLSDDPNDIANQVNIRQRHHAANDDDGLVNPESHD